MRIAIFRMEDRKYHLIWSFHHIVMDGWCLSLITKEVFDHYRALQEGREPEPSSATPYSNYIEWLDRQDQERQSGTGAGISKDIKVKPRFFIK